MADIYELRTKVEKVQLSSITNIGSMPLVLSMQKITVVEALETFSVKAHYLIMKGNLPGGKNKLRAKQEIEWTFSALNNQECFNGFKFSHTYS